MLFRSFPDVDAVSLAAAEEFIACARRAIAESGRFLVALAGGSTPKRLFQQLVSERFRSTIDWNCVEWIFGDERSVGPDSADSNFRMANAELFQPLKIAAEKIHRMRGEVANLSDAAADYATILAKVCRAIPGGPPPRLDLVLLGMGADGHTASLFPGTAAVSESRRWVVANTVPQLNTNRLTLSAAVINRAATVLFTVAGADKATALSAVLEGERQPDMYPSQLIRPTAGRLLWFVDTAAAAKLSPAFRLSHSDQVPEHRVSIAPSILAADFSRLGEQVQAAEAAGADRLHVDIMDGHFVPNISFGPLVVRALRKVTRLELECHLMISDPDRYLQAFVDAGADTIQVHVDGGIHVHRTLHEIRRLQCKTGVVINPGSPVSLLEEVIGDVDMVLVMTVNPGFGGQVFIESMLPKIAAVRRALDRNNPMCELEVDGGIDAHTAPLAVAAGADVLVAGSAVFQASDGIAAAMQRLKQSVGIDSDNAPRTGTPM